MTIKNSRHTLFTRFRTFFIAGVFGLFPLGLMADQKDPKLDELFAALMGTTEKSEASTITNLIWDIWLRTEDEEASQLMNQAIRSMSVGSFVKAREEFSEVIELEPEFAEAWNKRATVNYLMGDFSQSISDCEHVLALEPRHFGALSGLGLIYTELKNPELALDAFKEALEVNPFMPNILENIKHLEKEIRKKIT